MVATDHKPIPDKYRSWMITKLSLTFTDQFGYDYCAQAEVFRRSACLRNPDPRIRKLPALF